MNYYTVALFLSTLAMVIIQICVDKSNILTKKRKHLFKSLFNVIIVCSICEWCGWYLQSVDSKARLFHILVKTIELSLAPMIGCLVAWIIEKRDEKFVYWVLSINCILEVLSALFGFIFYVDVNGIYHHADFYWIYVVMYLLSLCYCNFIIFKNTKKYQYNGSGYFLVLSLFLLTGIGIQLFNSQLKVIYFTLCIGSIMLYVFTLEMISQTDELSGLLNRRGFENCVCRLENTSIVIFFDVDDFKNINDQYGHSFGDEVIEKIGWQLKRVYAKYGKCFRYGGDEFCVVLNYRLDDVETLNRQFLEYLRKEDINVSLGYAYYEVGHIHIDDVIKQADENMYQNKIKRKQDCDN